MDQFKIRTATDRARFVPRSSEAFATSWLIGLGAALFSLGLPVRSVSDFLVHSTNIYTL
jgi:hypothetical protein